MNSYFNFSGENEYKTLDIEHKRNNVDGRVSNGIRSGLGRRRRIYVV